MAVSNLQMEPEQMIPLPANLPEIPPLREGEYLTRDEFERRYAAMPEVRAELIEGRVVMSSPVRAQNHGAPHSELVGWLAHYKAFTPGVSVLDNTSTRLDLLNEPQPDVQLRIDEACGGQSQISTDDYVEGAPELAVEIAASTALYDLKEKKEAYRRNGVQEYIVWDISKRRLHWFRLTAGKYVALPLDADGIVRSRVFPGLWLAVEALLQGDLAQVLAVVQQGVASAEHTAFVEQLSARSQNQ